MKHGWRAIDAHVDFAAGDGQSSSPCTRTANSQRFVDRRCYDREVDVETASALERINERLDSLETSVRGDIAGIRGDIGGIRADIGGIHGDIGGIRGDIAGLRDDIADARRHATMLNESTRDEVRLVAEAVALLTIKVDSLSRR